MRVYSLKGCKNAHNSYQNIEPKLCCLLTVVLTNLNITFLVSLTLELKIKKHPAGNLSAFRCLRKLKCITKTVYNTVEGNILFKEERVFLRIHEFL